MKRMFFCLLMAFLAVIPMRVQAQIVDPVKWAFSIQDVNETEFDVVATATVDPQYHIYSTKMPELGPLPTTFEFESSPDYEVVGEARDVSAGEKYYDDIFEVEYVQFKGTAVYAQRLKKLTDKAFTVMGAISAQVCKEGGCVPVSADFEVNVPGADGSVLATTAVTEGNGTDVAPPAEDRQVVQAAGDDYDYFTSEGAESTDTSLWGMILSAILWGFAALLTPCVFPMVPMTVSFFMHGEGESKKEGRFKAFMYFLFIVLLYTLPIAILILITYFVGGESVTAGIFNWLATSDFLPRVHGLCGIVLWCFRNHLGQQYVEQERQQTEHQKPRRHLLHGLDFGAGVVLLHGSHSWHSVDSVHTRCHLDTHSLHAGLLYRLCVAFCHLRHVPEPASEAAEERWLDELGEGRPGLHRSRPRFQVLDDSRPGLRLGTPRP